MIVEHNTTEAPWFWDKDVYTLYAHVSPDAGLRQAYDPETGFLKPGFAPIYVQRGEHIAIVAPYFNGSHLHFEVRSGVDAWHEQGDAYAQFNFCGSHIDVVDPDYPGVTYHSPIAFLENPAARVPLPDVLSTSAELVSGNTVRISWSTTGAPTHVVSYLWKGPEGNEVNSTSYGSLTGVVANGSPQQGRQYNFGGEIEVNLPANLPAGNDYWIKTVAWDRNVVNIPPGFISRTDFETFGSIALGDVVSP